MSLTLALRSALSGLSVAQVGMDVAANNITNANTPGYTRKIAELSTKVIGNQGVGGGVEVRNITRNINTSLALEMRGVGSTLKNDEILAEVMGRTESLFGSPSSNSSLTAQLSKLADMFETVSVNPNDPVQHVQLINLARDVTLQIRDAESRIQDLRREADGRIETAVESINTELSKLSELNEKIMRGRLTGISTADLEDQRDNIVKTISEQIDIRTFERENGQMAVYTSTGYKLFDSTPQYINYTAVSSIDASVRYEDGDFNAIEFQSNAFPGDLTAHVRSGVLKGLVSLRDDMLPAMSDQLENITRALTDGLNALHNQGTAFPPPQNLTGTTHVNATDPFYATGSLRIAVTDAAGNYSDYIDIDLDALTKPGPTTVNDLITAVNGATSAVAGVGFGTLATMSVSSDGHLVLQGLGNRRVALGDSPSPATPATEEVSGSGKGISHYFGLNDFFIHSGQAVNPEELSSSRTMAMGDGFTGTGQVRFAVTDPDGVVQNSFDLNLASLGPTATINDLINSINGAAGLGMTASLSSDGRLLLHADSSTESVEVSLLYPPATHTASGQNFIAYFGLHNPEHTSASVKVHNTLIATPQRLSRGQLSPATVTPPITDPVPAIAPGDNRIASAMAQAFSNQRTFDGAGDISSLETSLISYSTLFLSTNAYTVDSLKRNETDTRALFDELTLRHSAASGVDLEEEMGNLVILENAYNAAAQVVKVTSEMFQKLEEVM